MSASPPASAIPSQKRPLEDPSSPSGPTDQPDAKRPALDKVLKEEDGTAADSTAANEAAVAANASGESIEPEEIKAEEAGVDGPEPVDTKPAVDVSTDNQGDTVVPDAPANGTSATAQILETQPIQSHTSANGRATSQGPMPYQNQDETGWLHVRAIISSAEAATVIGKGGENVTQIRRMAGAKCTVSEYSRGAVERILTVSGLVDAVAKVRQVKS